MANTGAASSSQSLCCTKSTTIWSTLISHPSLHWDSPVQEVMHLVSYNHSAAVLLTPTRSFLVLSGTGMHWWWIHYFFKLWMPSRTTTSLIRRLITFVFNLLFYPPETWLTQPLCICLLVWSGIVNGRRRRRRSLLVPKCLGSEVSGYLPDIYKSKPNPYLNTNPNPTSILCKDSCKYLPCILSKVYQNISWIHSSTCKHKSYFHWRVHWNFVHWSLFSVNGFTENVETIFYFQWRVHWNYEHWDLFSVNGSLKYRALEYFQWLASLRIKLN